MVGKVFKRSTQQQIPCSVEQYAATPVHNHLTSRDDLHTDRKK